MNPSSHLFPRGPGSLSLSNANDPSNLFLSFVRTLPGVAFGVPIFKGFGKSCEVR